MLKKTIKYTDYNGEEQTEDFYFNLSKAELTEMELFMEIATDAEASAAFVNGIIPTDVQQKVEAANKK